VTQRIRVGTRKSPLARAQTELVLRALARVHRGVRFEPQPVDTSGDRDLAPGGAPDFTDTIDRALLRGEVDLAVHSAKDLPSRLDAGLELAACPRRADARDCLVVRDGLSPLRLPPRARVGSSSLRRRAQLLRWRSDLEIEEIRGNVDTRVQMVRAGRIDGAVLAVAGLLRLGRAREVGRILGETDFLPAPAQGALALVVRAGDQDLLSIARSVDDAGTHAAVIAEREFTATLGGDCQVPLAALAKRRGRMLYLTGEVLSPDGRKRLRGSRAGPVTLPQQVGSALGRSMLDRGALDLFGRARP
jgi:hydroxymethylbilane synthase